MIKFIKNLPPSIKLLVVVAFVIVGITLNMYLGYGIYLVITKAWLGAGTIEKVAIAWLSLTGYITILKNFYGLIFTLGKTKYSEYKRSQTKDSVNE